MTSKQANERKNVLTLAAEEVGTRLGAELRCTTPRNELEETIMRHAVALIRCAFMEGAIWQTNQVLAKLTKGEPA